MPVIKSAKKKLRADRKRESVNKKIMSFTRLLIKKAERKPTSKNVQEAFSIIDKNVKKHTIHKNKASRIKSRLSKLLNKKSPIKTGILKTTKAGSKETQTKSHPVKEKNTKNTKK